MEILGRRYRIGTIIKVVFAVMGASSGISMCGVFRKKYNNVHAAVWAGASAAFAIFFLYIVFSVHRDVNRKIPPSRFKSYSFVGAVGAMAGLAGSIAYLIIAATNKESVNPHGSYVVVFWGVMTFKWSLYTFLLGRRYHKKYTSPDDHEDSTI